MNGLPTVTETGPTTCEVDVAMVPCRHCGYTGPFHIPAYPIADEEDGMFDSRVECPECESTGPSACYSLDHFQPTRDLARSYAVLNWNRLRATMVYDEIHALRHLEQAIRDMGAPHIMVSGQTQLESLRYALAEVEKTRAPVTPIDIPQEPHT